MKKILGSIVLFVLLILTVFALSKVNAPEAEGLGMTSNAYATSK